MPRYTAKQVAEQWAQGLSAVGASALTSDGTFLFSYQAIIGKRHVAPCGRVTFYLNRQRYSNTTSRHQSWASGAAAVTGNAVVVASEGIA